MSYKANVLVVDDDLIVCESCEMALTYKGHTVKTTLSGKEALEKVKEEMFDIALIDLKMPEMDGIEVLQALKKSSSEITVIMITGYPTIETAVKAQRLGVFDYVIKPFAPEELNIVVARALDNRQLVREKQRLHQYHVKTVLIADTNEEYLECLSIALVGEGYKVEVAKSGSEMIQKLRDNSDVGVIIMDVNMPVVRAYEVIPIVKRINRRIPIIVMSYNNSIELEKKVREAGIFFYAMKPLDIEEMKLVVRDAFKKVSRETS